LREREKTHKDSRAEARCESFQEMGKMGAKVIKTAKKNATWIEKLLKKYGQNFVQEGCETQLVGCETQRSRHPA
jgi:hypothetical protein